MQERVRPINNTGPYNQIVAKQRLFYGLFQHVQPHILEHKQLVATVLRCKYTASWHYLAEQSLTCNCPCLE